MYENLLPHHRATIEHLTEHYRADPRYRALIIGGSIVKALARPDSDVDIMLITTDEEFSRLSARQEFTLYRPDLSTYEGGYVDGKFLDYHFLLTAAARGGEPTRWSFVNAIIAFSDIPDLESLVRRIATYPIHEQQARIRGFYGQFGITNWYIGEAEKRNNAYLLARSTADLVLYACRLILAHNRMLFPHHKWMMTEIQRAPDKPADFIPLVENLLAAPGTASAKALYDCVMNFRDWGLTFNDAVNAFAEDTERYWLHGRPALADW
jgi:hypothetical protein